MKNALRIAVVAPMFALLAACGGPEFNGKNSVVFQESMQEMMKELSQEEARELGQAIQTLSMHYAGGMGGMSLESIKNMESRMLEELDGKTADDVIQMAKDVKKG